MGMVNLKLWWCKCVQVCQGCHVVIVPVVCHIVCWKLYSIWTWFLTHLYGYIFRIWKKTTWIQLKNINVEVSSFKETHHLNLHAASSRCANRDGRPAKRPGLTSTYAVAFLDYVLRNDAVVWNTLDCICVTVLICFEYLVWFPDYLFCGYIVYVVEQFKKWM